MLHPTTLEGTAAQLLPVGACCNHCSNQTHEETHEETQQKNLPKNNTLDAPNHHHPICTCCNLHSNHTAGEQKANSSNSTSWPAHYWHCSYNRFSHGWIVTCHHCQWCTVPSHDRTAPTNDSAMADLSPADNDDVPCLLTTTPMTAPSMIDLLPNDNSTHPHNEQWQLSSLQAPFNLQMQMLHTLNMLLVELDDKVNLLLAATCHKHNPLPSQLSTFLLPSTKSNTICKLTLQPHVHPPKTQPPPWTVHPANPCNTLAPVSKLSPYKKYVPAKPPFPHCRHCNMAMIWTKASTLSWPFPCASTSTSVGFQCNHPQLDSCA